MTAPWRDYQDDETLSGRAVAGVVAGLVVLALVLWLCA